MKRPVFFGAIAFILAVICALFYFNSLTFKVQKAIKGKDCTVNAAVIYNNYIWSTWSDGEKVPLLSVFKYFVALSVLHKISQENLSLNDKILITPDMISETTWSPMLKKYTPPFKISIENLMRYMISESDNNAADILIEYVGGIDAVKTLLHRFDFEAIEISANEKMMNEDIEAQYLNKGRAFDVALAMQSFREYGPSISDEYKEFLDKIMIETVTGEDKIKAGLPKDAVFGHKTGSSSRINGIKIADNDAGFVVLPDGSTYYVAIFVTESKMSDAENAALISQISKIIYNKMILR